MNFSTKTKVKKTNTVIVRKSTLSLTIFLEIILDLGICFFFL